MPGRKKEISRENDAVGEVLTFPPQSSIKIESHGKEDQRYYTWEIKIYCDDLDECQKLLITKNEEMKKYVKEQEIKI